MLNGDPHALTDEEFYELYSKAVSIADGCRPADAVELLTDLIIRAIDDVPLEHKLTIELRMYLGRALWRALLPTPAIEILRAALRDADRTCGSDDRITLAIRGNLARALAAAGEFDEARQIASKLYADRLDLFGAHDNGTLNSLGHLAHIWAACGDYRMASCLIDKQLRLRIEAFGDYDERNLSSWYHQHVFEAALYNSDESLHRAIAWNTWLCGGDSPQVATLLTRLAELYERQGKPEDAVDIWRLVTKLNTDYYGEMALDTLYSQSRLAKVEYALGPDSTRT